MYAIVHDGGHQYRVEPGQICEIQLKDTPVGESVTFDQVSFIGGDSPQIGQPYVSGAKVSATVLAETRGKKLVVRHFRRRKDSRTKAGHRQRYTQVRIESIDS